VRALFSGSPSRPWRLAAGASQAFSTSVNGPHGTTQEALAAFSVADVQTWAADIDGVLPVDVCVLVEQRVDGEQLLKMTKDEFGKAGIPLGPAGKIMDAIERVKSSGAYVFWHAILTPLRARACSPIFRHCPHRRHLLLLLDGLAVQLARPMAEWQPGEVFDVSGMTTIVADAGFHQKLFLRDEGLKLLAEWNAESPYMIAYGTPGIGKSALAQLAAARHLALGDPVLFRHKDGTWLMQYDDTRKLLAEEKLPDLQNLGRDRRPERSECVMIYDSPDGFQTRFGEVGGFKKVLIVHSPSGNLNNSRKAGGMSLLLTRLVPPPLLEEILTAATRLGVVGEDGGLTADGIERRVALGGPIFRRAFNPSEKEVREAVDAGIDKIVGAGIENVLNVHMADRLAHGVMLMQKSADGRTVYSFASDYIRDRVCNALAETDVTRLLKLANCVGVHGSLCGQIFENRMRGVLGSPGSITVKCKSESASRPGEMHIELTGESVAFGTHSPLPDQLRVGIVYAPIAKNNEAWDAFLILPTGDVCLLQYTIATVHPVSRKGLVQGLEAVASREVVDDAGRVIRSAGSIGSAQSRLVFVVPPTAFSAFNVPQRVVKADGDVEKRRAIDCQEVWQVETRYGVALW
jgi:hypothetical protein